MTVQTFIEKAVEGGYHADRDWLSGLPEYALCQMWLDPAAWKAVGKVEQLNNYPKWAHGGWKEQMHDLIDHLAEGGTIESYLETL